MRTFGRLDSHGDSTLTSVLRTPMGGLGVYLAVTLPLVSAGALGVGDAMSWAIAVTHAAVAAAALVLARGSAAERWWALAVPLLAIPFAYAEVPWMNQVLGQGFQDPTVLGWDLAMFGFDPARELAGRYPSSWLSETLHLAYVSFYPGIYVLPLVLAVQRRREAFATASLGLILTGASCYVLFTLYPVQGPRYFGPPVGVPDGPIRGLVLLILENASSQGAAFPSAHMALMTCQSLLALRFVPRIGVALAVLTFGVGAGAVYGGFHYAVDIVAGLALGALVVPLVLRLRGQRTRTALSADSKTGASPGPLP